MKLYLLMYLFFAKTTDDPFSKMLTEVGILINPAFQWVNIFMFGTLLIFIFGIFLFHSAMIIIIAGKLIRFLSPKFSNHLLELAEVLRRKRDYQNYANENENTDKFQWLKGLGREKYSGRRTFEVWMQKIFTREYSNNVTALAYFGASFLIFIIGLRGIRIGVTQDTPNLVIFGIFLEVCMLILLAFTQFYTPEYPEELEPIPPGPIDARLKKLEEELNNLRGRLSVAENNAKDAIKFLQDAQNTIDDTNQDIWTISKRS